MFYTGFLQKPILVTTSSLLLYLFQVNEEFLKIDSITKNDLYLSLMSAIFGFYLLFILLILKNTNLQPWIMRKIVHLIGGSYIAFMAFQYQKITGILLTLGIFSLIFIILVIFSKGVLITEYFMLDFRKGEKKHSFLVNTVFTLIVLFISLIQLSNYPIVFTAGVLVLAWADSFGEIFGRIFPIKEFKIINKKSLSGSFSVFILSNVSFFLTLIFYHIPISVDFYYKILLGSFICMFIEAMSWKWLDNVFLPIIGNLVMLWIILT